MSQIPDQKRAKPVRGATHLAASLSVIDSASGDIEDRPPLIPPGEYQVKFERWATCIMWGRQAKLIAWFSVVDYGEHFGVRLPRYYNVKRLVGKAGNYGRFKASWNCDLVREYAGLLTAPTRLDRIYLDHLKTLLIVATVATVNKTAEQEDWPEALKYSVIRKLRPSTSARRAAA